MCARYASGSDQDPYADGDYDGDFNDFGERFGDREGNERYPREGDEDTGGDSEDAGEGCDESVALAAEDASELEDDAYYDADGNFDMERYLADQKDTDKSTANEGEEGEDALGPWNGWGVAFGLPSEPRLLAVVGTRVPGTNSTGPKRRASTWGSNTKGGSEAPGDEGARWSFALVPLPLKRENIFGNGTYILDIGVGGVGGSGGSGGSSGGGGAVETAATTVWTWCGPRSGLWERRAAAKAADVLCSARRGHGGGKVAGVVALEQSAPYVAFKEAPRFWAQLPASTPGGSVRLDEDSDLWPAPEPELIEEEEDQDEEGEPAEDADSGGEWETVDEVATNTAAAVCADRGPTDRGSGKARAFFNDLDSDDDGNGGTAKANDDAPPPPPPTAPRASPQQSHVTVRRPSNPPAVGGFTVGGFTTGGPQSAPPAAAVAGAPVARKSDRAPQPSVVAPKPSVQASAQASDEAPEEAGSGVSTPPARSDMRKGRFFTPEQKAAQQAQWEAGVGAGMETGEVASMPTMAAVAPSLPTAAAAMEAPSVSPSAVPSPSSPSSPVPWVEGRLAEISSGEEDGLEFEATLSGDNDDDIDADGKPAARSGWAGGGISVPGGVSDGNDGGAALDSLTLSLEQSNSQRGGRGNDGAGPGASHGRGNGGVGAWAVFAMVCPGEPFRGDSSERGDGGRGGWDGGVLGESIIFASEGPTGGDSGGGGGGGAAGQAGRLGCLPPDWADSWMGWFWA